MMTVSAPTEQPPLPAAFVPAPDWLGASNRSGLIERLLALGERVDHEAQKVFDSRPGFGHERLSFLRWKRSVAPRVIPVRLRMSRYFGPRLDPVPRTV